MLVVGVIGRYRLKSGKRLRCQLESELPLRRTGSDLFTIQPACSSRNCFFRRREYWDPYGSQRTSRGGSARAKSTTSTSRRPSVSSCNHVMPLPACVAMCLASSYRTLMGMIFLSASFLGFSSRACPGPPPPPPFPLSLSRRHHLEPRSAHRAAPLRPLAAGGGAHLQPQGEGGEGRTGRHSLDVMGCDGM